MKNSLLLLVVVICLFVPLWGQIPGESEQMKALFSRFKWLQEQGPVSERRVLETLEELGYRNFSPAEIHEITRLLQYDLPEDEFTHRFSRLLERPDFAPAQPPAGFEPAGGYSSLSSTDTGDSLNMRLVGRWANGPCYAVAVVGNIAYFGNGAYLEIVDFSDPASPVELGKALVPEPIEGVAVSGDYAYVADYESGLRVIAISDPANPHEVGYFNTGGWAYGVAVSGNYAYVADWYNGLRVIDVSKAANPQEVGFLYMGVWGDSYGVAVSGVYAYVADELDGLRIIDISDPTNPWEVGFFDTGGDAHGVAVSGAYAYVADHSAGLRAIDISDPTNPQETGYFDTRGYALDVAVSGDYAYVADHSAGLRAIDISDPTKPQEVGYFDTGGSARGVAVSGNYAYVADEDDGLYILEYLGTAPESPNLSQPDNNAFTNDNNPSLTWQVPTDSDGDALHFKIELATNSSFTNQIPGSPYESKTSTTGFSPTPPLAEGSGSCSFTLQSALNEGTYYWRVSATDGDVYGAVSSVYKFTIDTSPPYTSDHNPTKYAQNVPINNGVMVHVNDKYSGVNQSSIVMKINGSQVEPAIIGTSTKYSVLAPPIDFEYGETVTVSIDAEDNAGNKMNTDSYSFTIESKPNSAPAVPTLWLPANNSFTNERNPHLSWIVPADQDGDDLHFKVELSRDRNWGSNTQIFESKISTTGFNPEPPVAQGSGGMIFTVQSTLSEGDWWWRVAAWDGQVYGSYSNERKFTVDLTPPFTTNHKPSKNATGVARSTDIIIQVRDALSGVNQSFIVMKINGSTVTPSMTDSAGVVTLNYDPPNDFDYEETVNVSINAKDNAGNAMTTDSYSFTTAGEDNTAPAAPTVTAPANNSYTNDNTPKLSWMIPVDQDSNQLHFKVEIDNDHDWSSITQIIESKTQTSGFIPRPPIAQDSGSACYIVQSALVEGDYWWRVAAWDGQVYGNYSDERKFTVDLTPPFTTNHKPSKNATGVARSTDISVQIRDALSGMNQSFFVMKINGSTVTPSMTDSAGVVSLNYDPPTDFDYKETISVSINATDNAGNAMTTDSYSFTTASETNTAPAAPTLTTPENDSYLNDATPSFTWSVPTDVNDDQLHFKLELDNDHNWTNISQVIESKTSNNGFSPTPPLNQGAGNVTYTTQSALAEGDWWWRVSAWDGQVYSSYSSERHFIVDVTKPFTASHHPEKNASDVPINTNIAVHIKDNVSGVKQSTIVIKVNGTQVNPTISGEATDFSVTYDPPTDFNHESTVTVSIDAEDQAGNKMDTDSYSFTTAAEGPLAPAAPLLATPEDSSYTNDTTPQLNWSVPSDQNGDMLHFKVEIATNGSFADQIASSPFESQTSTTGFSPTPPLAEGSGSCSFTPASNLADGAYWWRVTAWDGTAYGSSSDSRQFIIDTRGPIGYTSNAPATNDGNPYTVTVAGATDGAGCGVGDTFLDVFTSDVDTPTTKRSSMEGMITDGTYLYRYYVTDLLGNQGEIKSDTTVVTTGTSPTITLTNPTGGESWEVGTNQTIIWQTTGYIANVSIEISRDGGESKTVLTNSTENDGNWSWEVTNPTSDKCLIFISDAQKSHIVAQSATVFSITPEYTSGLNNPNTQPYGNLQTAYRMISVPIELKEPLVSTLLSDDLGLYDNTKWRLFDYQSDGVDFSRSNWIEYSDTMRIHPGRSYFLIVKDPNKKIIAGGGYLIGDIEYEIPLNAGWDLIANPYNFELTANHLELKSANAINLWTYQGSWIISTQFQPWQGYALHTNSTDTLVVQPDWNSMYKITPANLWATTEWFIQIRAQCQAARDDMNYCGVFGDARIEYDVHDLREPPFIGEYVAVYFPHENWSIYPGRYATDFQPEKENGYAWEFMVSTVIANEAVQLNFEVLLDKN